jgi:osmoprotectant transport system substrate-binding protein
MSSFIIRSALVNDQIDLYVEYTGTAWMAYLKQQDIIDDPVLLLEKVREKDLLENGIVWYDAIDFNNTYGLAIKEEFARENNLETLSDLADYINQNNKLIFGVNFDFFERPDGFFAMAEITVWSSVKRTSKPWKSVSPMKHYQEAISMWPWFFQQTGNWINIT